MRTVAAKYQDENADGGRRRRHSGRADAPATIPGMVRAVIFDSHRFMKNLKRGGFTEPQAEALAREWVILLPETLATTADIGVAAGRPAAPGGAAEVSICGDIEAAKVTISDAIGEAGSAIESQIEALRRDLLKWMGWALVAQTVLIVALLRLL